MRILDTDNDKSVHDIIIYLTKSEADNFLSSLTDLVKWNDVKRHVHSTDDDDKHEITMVIYDENHMDSLDERSKEIIRSDT